MGLTKIYTKKKFIEMLTNNIEEDEVILMTTDTEKLEYVEKKNVKRITFGFAADAFKKQGIKSLMTGEVVPVSFCITKREQVTDQVLKIVDESNEKERQEKQLLPKRQEEGAVIVRDGAVVAIIEPPKK